MADKQDSFISGGIKWGPFQLRVPLIHTGFSSPEFIQGLFITLSTSMGLAPLLTGEFGLSFNQAITMALFHYLLISSSALVFGEPFAPGWITPALPLTLTYVLGSYADPTERFQAMAAISIDLAVIVLVLGLTGLGEKLFRWLPTSLKAGIILGAAFAAFKRVFLDDFDHYFSTPVATTLAITLSLLLAFSVPLGLWKQRYPFIQRIATLGLLPGFAVAALAAVLLGEIKPELQFGFLIPDVMGLWEKASPVIIGLPGWHVFLDGLPLALITYTIVFGDMITGQEMTAKAQEFRPDDPIDISPRRMHLSLGIRNAVMAVVAPFFPSQGILWSGVHAVILNRWKEGPKVLPSLFTGISNYYVFGLPILMLFLPLILFLKPLLPVTFALTLVMTGFACAMVATAIPESNEEHGVTVLTAACLAVLPPWMGLAIGLVAHYLIVGAKPLPKTG